MKLSVVIPSYNSQGWISRTLAALHRSYEGSLFSDLEVIVVDDGSDDHSPHEAEETAKILGIELSIIRQPNMGRHRARLAGIRKAVGSHLLLIDTRVFLDENSLDFVSRQFRQQPCSVWTAHVTAMTETNPIAGFWQGIEHIAWRTYFKEPSTTSFGLQEFDYFPKGTTALIGERNLLAQAFSSYEPSVEDWRHANDDTAVLRSVAQQCRINISPQYSCIYNARSTVSAFLQHARHRGTVLIDGYWRRGSRYCVAINLFLLGSVTLPFVLIGAFLKFPAILVVGTVLALSCVATSAVFVLSQIFGATRHDAHVLARYLPLFAIWYGAGIWKGAVLRLYRTPRDKTCES